MVRAKRGEKKPEELKFYRTLYICDLMAMAKAGTDLLYYTYPKCENNMIPALRLSYVRKVDGDWWLGSGFYANEVDQTEGVMPPYYEPPITKRSW